MTNELSRENASEIEAYGEFGLLPKVGVKIRLSRKDRLERVIDSAAKHTELGREELEDRLVDADERVLNVVQVAALRAGEVDDDAYLDALGRLIAGALDSAEIDEFAYITSEVVKLEPVHLRALLTFFFFGQKGSSASETGLSPSDAGWASLRDRKDQEISHLLKMSEGGALQVLSTLRRDGYLDKVSQTLGGEAFSRASGWAQRVLTTLFPGLEIHVREVPAPSGGSGGAPAPSLAAATKVQVSVPEGDPYMREHRAIGALEEEIKKVERARFGPLAVRVATSEAEWLGTLKRRLRKVDPDNPWAYDDFD